MGYFETSLSCINQRKYVNIPAWHEHGFTGKGLTIFHDDLGKTSHNQNCVDIIQTILPDARVLSGSISCSTANGELTECFIYCNETEERLPFEDFIEKYDVSQINNSTTSSKVNLAVVEYMKSMIQKHNLFCTGALGNYDEAINDFVGAFVIVGGVYPDLRDYRSAEGSDFKMFMGYQNGTSFASPFLNAMGGLVRCKYGRITQDKICEYLKEHTNNIPILGRPEMKIVMQIGNHRALVEGKEVLLDQAPVIDKVSNRTLTPARFVAEALGAKVTWNAEDKTIVIER